MNKKNFYDPKNAIDKLRLNVEYPVSPIPFQIYNIKTASNVKDTASLIIATLLDKTRLQ